MKILAVFMSIGFGLLMASAVLASAASLSVQEISLTSYGEAYEVNLGSDGYLYVSDLTAKQIWRLNPNDLSVKKYQLAIQVLDARPDSAGNIWFTDGSPTFARLNQNTNQAVSWEVPITHNLQGLTF